MSKIQNPIIVKNRKLRRSLQAEAKASLVDVSPNTFVDMIPGVGIDSNSAETLAEQGTTFIGVFYQKLIALKGDLNGTFLKTVFDASGVGSMVMLDAEYSPISNVLNFTSSVAVPTETETFQCGCEIVTRRQFLTTYPSATDKHLVGSLIAVSTNTGSSSTSFLLQLSSTFDIDTTVGCGVKSAIAKSPCAVGANAGNIWAIVAHNQAAMQTDTPNNLVCDVLSITPGNTTPDMSYNAQLRSAITYPQGTADYALKSTGFMFFFGAKSGTNVPVYSLKATPEYRTYGGDPSYELDIYASSLYVSGETLDGRGIDAWSNFDGIGVDGALPSYKRLQSTSSSGGGVVHFDISALVAFDCYAVVKTVSGKLYYYSSCMNYRVDGYGGSGGSGSVGVGHRVFDCDADIQSGVDFSCTPLQAPLEAIYGAPNTFLDIRSYKLFDPAIGQQKLAITYNNGSGKRLVVTTISNSAQDLGTSVSIPQISTIIPKTEETVDVISQIGAQTVVESYPLEKSVTPASEVSGGMGVTVTACTTDNAGIILVNEQENK